MTLVMFLEEPSMKNFLEGLLPRLAPDVRAILIPHAGKQDLERSLVKKLKAWRDPTARFFVLRDQDAADCKVVKAQLAELCARAGKPETVVRIVCRALESWYLADLEAVDKAYGTRLAKQQQTKKLRDPDRLHSPDRELETLVPRFSKGAGGRALGPLVDLDNERSPSFFHFVSAVRAAVREESGDA